MTYKTLKVKVAAIAITASSFSINRLRSKIQPIMSIMAYRNMVLLRYLMQIIISKTQRAWSAFHRTSRMRMTTIRQTPLPQTKAVKQIGKL